MSVQVLVSKTQNRHFGAKVPFLPDRLIYYIYIYIERERERERKTRNLYEVEKEQYSKLLMENVTKHYRVADESAYDNVNLAAKKIANKLGSDLAERMESRSGTHT